MNSKLLFIMAAMFAAAVPETQAEHRDKQATEIPAKYGAWKHTGLM